MRKFLLVLCVVVGLACTGCVKDKAQLELEVKDSFNAQYQKMVSHTEWVQSVHLTRKNLNTYVGYVEIRHADGFNPQRKGIEVTTDNDSWQAKVTD